MNAITAAGAVLVAALSCQPGCAEDASPADPCSGADAPALGCVCLSGGHCSGHTGLRLSIEAGALAAPGDPEKVKSLALALKPAGI